MRFWFDFGWVCHPLHTSGSQVIERCDSNRLERPVRGQQIEPRWLEAGEREIWTPMVKPLAADEMLRAVYGPSSV